ncbi:MAG: hypothetical protein ACI4TM_09605 [Candidatus Cryptobacteroides sp.]
MKKINITLAAILSVMAISCNKELEPTAPETSSTEKDLVEKTFYASYDQNASETKVAVGEISGTTVYLNWEVNDEIALLTEGANTIYKATASDISGNAANFTANVPQASTYYAVYPASAVETEAWYTDSNPIGLLVTIPNVQQAVDDSFDPKAYVATAVTTDNTITFTSIASAFKFNLGDEAEKIEKVILQVNGSTNVAGTGILYTNKFGLHDWLTGPCTSYKEITLNSPSDGFKTGKSYYITYRSNKCGSGITLYFVYKDKTVKKISSSKALNVNGQVKDLGDVVTKAKALTSGEAYELGFDIRVGDVILNKNINGDANYVSNTNETAVNLTLSSGVNFIEGTFQISSNSSLKISSDTYIIANKSATLNFNKKNMLHNAGILGIKDVTIDGSSNSNYLFSTLNATVDAKQFILDGCTITTPIPVFSLYNCTSTCKNLYIIDTDIKLTDNRTIFDLSATTVSSTPETITIKNSILYAENNLTSAKLVQVRDIENVIFDNNTVYSLNTTANNGLIQSTGTIENLSLNNNLFTFNPVSADSEKVVNGTVTSPTVENNYFYNSEEAKTMTLYGSNLVSWESSPICSDTHPFDSYKTGAGATR